MESVLKATLPHSDTETKSSNGETEPACTSLISQTTTKPSTVPHEEIEIIKNNVTHSQDNSKELAGNETKKSKRQLKREIKMKRWEEIKLQKRAKERERKKQKRQMMQEAGIEFKKSKPKQKMSSKSASKIRVAIDLSFNHLMVEKDRKKLAQQIRYCYTANRTSDKPVQFYICSFGNDNEILLDKNAGGYKNWDVYFTEEKYEDAFNATDIVYLTSDSDNILRDLEDDKVYIIGGLIDHNAHKGLCLKLAVEKGISHAQLPIGEYLRMSTRKVLTINHVMEILVNYVTLRDWEQALFKAIPKRKGASLISKTSNVPQSENNETVVNKGNNEPVITEDSNQSNSLTSIDVSYKDEKS